MAITLQDFAHWLDAMELPYEVDLEHDRVLIGVPLPEDEPLMLVMQLEEEGEFLRLIAPKIMMLSHPDQEAVLQTLLAMGWNGNPVRWQVDPTDGEVRAEVDLPLEDGELTRLQFQRNLAELVQTVARARPRLRAVLETGSDPQLSMTASNVELEQFLREILQAEYESQGDANQVYAVFARQPELINAELSLVLREYGATALSQMAGEEAEGLVGLIENICVRLTDFPLGNRANNLEVAIDGYQWVLSARPRETLPEKWAQTQNNLGNAYSNRIKGDRADNIEQAIAAYLLAREVYTRDDFPVQWAMTQNNLGNAYSDRIKGDQANNIEQAIAAYLQALDVYTRDDFPVQRAGTQNNLGAAYSNRIKGDRADNIEQAIAAYLQALDVYTRDDFPVDWAMTQNNLGAAYRNRIKGDRADNIEQAIAAYHLALDVYTRDDFPEQWAMTQNNLGAAYSDRIKGDRADNIEQAIAAYHLALDVYTRDDFPVQWAMTQNNLGAAYSNPINGDRAENLEQAVQCWRSALEIYKPQLEPLECLRVGRNLGNAAFTKGWWEIAIEGYSQAIAAVEQSRSWATTEKRRQEILDEAVGVYDNMVQACINADELELALQTVERVRSKRLVDLMATHDLYKDGNIPDPVRQLIQAYEAEEAQEIELRSEIAQPDSSETNDQRQLTRSSRRNRSATVTQELEQHEAEKRKIRDELSRYDAVSAGLLTVQPPDLQAIQHKLLDQPTTAILSFYSTSDDTHIFVVRRDQIQRFTCEGQGLKTLQIWLIQQWITPYVTTPSTWEEQIPNVLKKLAQRLEIDRLIQTHLQDVTELILIPHLYLHLIPFAALPITSSTPGEKFLSDQFLLRYAPSCQVLEFCRDRDLLDPSPLYGTAENATEDLPFAAIEGEIIAELFQIAAPLRLRGQEQATVEAYRQLLEQVRSIVSCHHAQSRLDNPLESALILANHRKITLGQLLTPGWRFKNLEDIFLSCCETGMMQPQSITDEVLTLGTGFLCAGARNVTSSLWEVTDLATMLFSRFYHHYRHQRKPRVLALQQAQRDLRNLTQAQLQDLSPTLKSNLETQKAALEKHYKLISKQRKQFKRDDAAYKKLNSERDALESKIACLAKAIESLDTFCQQERPFEHPVYWSAFTCQGLR